MFPFKVAQSCAQSLVTKPSVVRQRAGNEVQSLWSTYHLLLADEQLQVQFRAHGAVSFKMHLYNLTLQPPTSVTQAIVGNFSGVRQQEIIISRGTRLELLRPDVQTGKITTVLAHDVFGSVRSLAAFRLTGGTKGVCNLPFLSRQCSHFSSDYAIVGSDSGRLVILEYDPKTNSFLKLHQETYGKSGARRIVPGQYLATDPKGRSVMVSAMEKAKLVYILNRDPAANLTISSPLEAHKNAAIIHHIVGLDVGFENPMYAALEVDYTESDQDPTGEAFNNAEKVRIHSYSSILWLTSIHRC